MQDDTLRRFARGEGGGRREARSRPDSSKRTEFRHSTTRSGVSRIDNVNFSVSVGTAIRRSITAALPTAGRAEPGAGLPERRLHPDARRHRHHQFGSPRDRERDPGLSRVRAVRGTDRSGRRSSGVVIRSRLAVVHDDIFGPVRIRCRAPGSSGRRAHSWARRGPVGQLKRRSGRRPPIRIPSCAKLGSSCRPRAIRFPPRMVRSLEIPSLAGKAPRESA